MSVAMICVSCQEQLSRLSSYYHYHLHLRSCGSVFHDDIIQEDYFCQLHGHIIFIPENLNNNCIGSLFNMRENLSTMFTHMTGN